MRPRLEGKPGYRRGFGLFYFSWFICCFKNKGGLNMFVDGSEALVGHRGGGRDGVMKAGMRFLWEAEVRENDVNADTFASGAGDGCRAPPSMPLLPSNGGSPTAPRALTPGLQTLRLRTLWHLAQRRHPPPLRVWKQTCIPSPPSCLRPLVTQATGTPSQPGVQHSLALDPAKVGLHLANLQGTQSGLVEWRRWGWERDHRE